MFYKNLTNFYTFLNLNNILGNPKKFQNFWKSKDNVNKFFKIFRIEISNSIKIKNFMKFQIPNFTKFWNLFQICYIFVIWQNYFANSITDKIGLNFKISQYSETGKISKLDIFDGNWSIFWVDWKSNNLEFSKKKKNPSFSMLVNNGSFSVLAKYRKFYILLKNWPKFSKLIIFSFL